MPSENVQHNLNADVAIEFSSGLQSLQEFANQVAGLNAEFERWSNTTTSLEERIRKSFDLLTKNIGRADTTTEAIDSKVMSAIQREINRAITDYVDSLDFRKALFTHGDIREAEKSIQNITKKLYGDLKRSIDRVYDFLVGSDSGSAEGVKDEIARIQGSIQSTFNGILSDSTTEYVEKIKAIKSEGKKLTTEISNIPERGDFASEVRELKDYMEAAVRAYQENIARALENHAKIVKLQADSTPVTDLSQKALSEIRQKVKSAIVESLQLNIRKGSLKVTLDKEALEKIKGQLSSQISAAVADSFAIEFEGLDEKTTLKISNKAFDNIWTALQTKFAEILLAVDLKTIADIPSFDVTELENKIDEVKTAIRTAMYEYIENFKIVSFDEPTKSTKKKKPPKDVRKLEDIQSDIDKVESELSQYKVGLSLIPEGRALEAIKALVSKSERELVSLEHEYKKSEKVWADYAKESKSKTKRKKTLVPQDVVNRFVDRVSESLSGLFDFASLDGLDQLKTKLHEEGFGFEKLTALVEQISDSISTESLEKLQKSVDAFMQKLATVAEEIASIDIKGGKTKVSKKNIVESVSAKITQELEEALASTNLDTMKGIKDRVKALYTSFKKLSDALSTILSEERTSINSTLLPLQKAIAEIGNGFVDITEALGNIKSGSLPNSGDFSKKISSLSKKFNDVAKVIDSIASIDKGSITSQLLPFQKELNKLGNIFMDINGALNNVGTNTMGQLRVAVDSFKESLEHIGEEIASVGGAGGGEFDIKKYQEMYRKQILNTLNEENIGHINILRDIREGKGSFEDVEKYINHRIRQEAEARRNLRTVLGRNKLEFDTPIKEALKLEAFRKDYKDYKLEGIIPSGDLSSLDTFKKFYDISQSSTDYYIRKEKRLAEILKGESDLLDKFDGKKWTSISKEEIHKTISGSNLSELIVKSIQEKIVNQITAVTNNISALLDNSFKDDVDVKKIEKSIGNLKTKISVNLVKSLNGVIEDLTKLLNVSSIKPDKAALDTSAISASINTLQETSIAIIKDIVAKFSETADQIGSITKSKGGDIPTEVFADIRSNIKELGKNFSDIGAALRNILEVKKTVLDSKLLPMQKGISNLGKSFDAVNNALKRSGAVGFKASVEAFAKELERIDAAAKALEVNLPVSELNSTLEELRQEFRNAENGVTASNIVMNAVNKKIVEFVNSLRELSAKIVNVDAETLNIKLTQEQLDSLDAQIGSVKITNLKDVSEPFGNAIKKLLENASTVIESHISGSIDPTKLKIPKKTTNKIISALSKMVSGFVDGFVDSLASQVVAPTFEVSTIALPKGIKSALAAKANMAVRDYVKKNPRIGGHELIAQMMETGIYDISSLFFNVSRQSSLGLINEYKDAIKDIKIVYDNSPVEFMIDRLGDMQTTIINKIKEIMRVQFSHIDKEIKAMKLAPVGFNYVPTDIKTTTPSKARTVRSFGAETSIPRGNISVQVPYRVGADISFDDLYQRAGGIGSRINNRTLLNSILNTIRYILAGTLLRVPLGAVQQGWQSSKQLELALTRAANNLRGLTVEENRSYTDTRIERIFELGLQKQYDYLKDLQMEEAKEREYTQISNLISGGLKRDLQALALQYIIPQDKVGEMFQFATRSTRNPYEALALTEAAVRLYAVEPEIGTPEEVARKLQSLSVIWGVSGFDMGKYASMIYSASTQVTASGQDILAGLVRGGPSLRQSMSGGVMDHPELNALRERISKEIDEETKKRLLAEYDNLEKEITFAYALPLIGLFEEATSRTGSETGRAYEQIFRALRSPEVYKSFDRLLKGRPELEYLRPYVQEKDPETGIVRNIAKNQAQVLIDFLDALPELRKYDAHEADSLLTKITGRYSGAFEALTSVLEEFADKWPEYVSESNTVFANWAEAIRKASDEKMLQDIVSLTETREKRLQQIPVMWGITLDEVMSNFNKEVNNVVDSIMTLLRAIHDNAGAVAAIFKNVVNVLVGAGIRHFGNKAIDSVNAKILAEERDRMLSPWKTRMQETVGKRFETQRDIFDQDKKLKRAVDIYEQARKRYFELTGIALEPLTTESAAKPKPTTVRSYLEMSDENVERALLALYSRQTESEQRGDYTAESNMVGFNMFDAPSLSRMAKKLLEGAKLSPGEVWMARRRLRKYAGQLAAFGEDLFDSDKDIQLITGSEGAVGLVDKLRQYEQELSEAVAIVESVDFLSKYNLGDASDVLKTPKSEFVGRVTDYIHGLYAVALSEDSIVELEQLKDQITDKDSEEYKSLLEDIEAAKKKSVARYGIERVEQALLKYQQSEVDFNTLQEIMLKSLIDAKRKGEPLSIDLEDRLDEARSEYTKMDKLVQAYERTYGKDAKETIFAVKRRDEVGRRIAQLESGRLSGEELEGIASMYQNAMRVSVDPANLEDNRITLERLRDHIAILEDESEKVLNKSNQAMDTYSAVISRKADMLKTLAETDTEIQNMQKTISNIISAYDDMGAMSEKTAKSGTTRGGIRDLFSAEKLKEKTSTIKESFVKTLRHYGINMVPSEIASILNTGDPERIKSKFGAAAPLVSKVWELINDADSAADQYVKNLTRQSEIEKRIKELKDTSGIPITDTGEVDKEAIKQRIIDKHSKLPESDLLARYSEEERKNYYKFVEEWKEKVRYTSGGKLPEHLVKFFEIMEGHPELTPSEISEMVQSGKIGKAVDEDAVMAEVAEQLKAISESNSGIELKKLATELSNLRIEAEKLAASSKTAAAAQAELNEAQMRADAEYEAGGESEEYIKKTKEAQGFQERSVIASLFASIGAGLKSMLINWIVGSITTFVVGTIAEAVQPKDIKARKAYEEVKELAAIMDSDREGQKLWEKVKAFFAPGNKYMSDILGIPDLFPKSTAKREIVNTQSPEEREAIVKKYLEEYYEASREMNISETRVQTLAEKAIIEAFSSNKPIAESLSASLEAIQTALEYWESWLSTLTAMGEADLTVRKFELTLKGLSANSEEMIQLEKEFAETQLKHYEEALAGVEAMIEQHELLLAGGAEKVGELAKEANVSFSEMLEQIKSDPSFALKKADSDIMKLLESERNNLIKAIAGYRDTLENIFTEFSKNLTYINEKLSAETAKVEAMASKSRLDRWLQGTADYSEVAVTQEINALYDKAMADAEAANAARKKFDTKIAPELQAEIDKHQNTYDALIKNNIAVPELLQNTLETLRDTYTLRESEVLQLESAANASMLQYQKALEEMPYSASETVMNMAAARADLEARIAIAQAQLRGLGEDSLYERVMTRQRLEEQNVAFGIRIRDLEKIIEKGSPNEEKYRIEILELLAKQNENLVAIRKLNENRVSFGLPDGLVPITYNDILQATATDRTFTGQRNDVNVNITFDHVNFVDPNSVRRVERDLTDAINRAVSRAIR